MECRSPELGRVGGRQAQWHRNRLGVLGLAAPEWADVDEKQDPAGVVTLGPQFFCRTAG